MMPLALTNGKGSERLPDGESASVAQKLARTARGRQSRTIRTMSAYVILLTAMSAILYKV
jgi:hypothetical protein